MHLTSAGTAIAISLLFTCGFNLAQERSVSSSQRYVMHVPQKVKLGLQPSSVKEPIAQQGREDVESLVFVAETTSGVTIQFETESKQPLKLTVGSGNWWASASSDVTGSTSEVEAEAGSVQATTFRPGGTTLHLEVAKPAIASTAEVTTIVVTIAAH